MLRFANITLANPSKPKRSPVDIQAIVTSEDFTLTLGAGLAAKLGLTPKPSIKTKGIRTNDKASVQKSLLGPLTLSWGNQKISVEAVQCGSGAVIGKQLLGQLKLDDKPNKNVAAVAKGETPRPFNRIKLIEKILIKEKVIDEARCRQLLDYIPGRARIQATVGGGKLRRNIRSVDNVNTKGIRPELNELFYKLYKEHVEPFYQATVEKWEAPQILSYGPGDKYAPHIDGEKRLKKEGEKAEWIRLLDRDVSILLYLNDDFTGGPLQFPNLKLKIQPRPGLLVAFPSSRDYLHGAMPVENGQRVVLVSWVSFHNTPRGAKSATSTIYTEKFLANRKDKQ